MTRILRNTGARVIGVIREWTARGKATGEAGRFEAFRIDRRDEECGPRTTRMTRILRMMNIRVIGVIGGRKSCLGCPRMTRMARIPRIMNIRVTGVIRAQTLSLSAEALETGGKDGSSQTDAIKWYWNEIRDIQIVQRIPSLHSDCIRIHPARGASSGVCADRRRRARTGTDGNDLHDKRDLHGAAEPRPLDISR